MVLATGVGSFPGTDQHAYEEALRLVLGELGPPEGLPFLPEVPGRGAHADLVGRTLGLVTELDADLQPAGWRLTGTSGGHPRDQRRARSLLAQDLDALEERAEGYAGPFKVQVAGPWTLAATVERPRGDRLLADHGARRDLTQALAVAVADHVHAVRRRLGGVDRLVVQVDEPALTAVLAGRVPTASGLGRHRSPEPSDVSAALECVLGAVADAGAEPWVHCCAADAPLALLRAAGARGLAVDLSVVGGPGQEVLGEALEAGDPVALGVVPATAPSPAPTVTQVVESAQRWLDRAGLDQESVTAALVLSPACGLAGAGDGWARRALELVRSAGRAMSG